MNTIHSRQNPIVRQLLKLAEHRRERLKLGLTVLSGTHLVAGARDAGWPIQRLLVREGSQGVAEIAGLLDTAISGATMLAPEIFDAIEQMPSPTGLLAIAAVPASVPPRRDGFCLLLDAVQDPGNVGSILRSAAAAGVDQVWLGTGCADAWSPKVLRAAMGAHFVLPIVERMDPLAALADFEGECMVTSLQGAHSLYDSDLRGNLVLALGAEGRGIDPGLEARATRRVLIPMQPGVESLNVAAAAAVCLFERRRQHLA